MTSDPGPAGVIDDGLGEFAEWRRVDPRTPLIYAAPVALVGLWIALAASVSDNVGPSGVRAVGGNDAGGLLSELAFPLIGVLIVVVRYLTGRYAVVDGAVRWQVGLFVHRATDIGLDRIQDVEVTRPLLARMLGLAQVSVSSAGGAGEIKLVYLDHRVAERLGHVLQHRIALERHAAARQGVPTAPIGGISSPVAAAPAVVLHHVTARELSAWAALRLWPALPVAVVAVILATFVDWRVALGFLPALPVWLRGIVRPLFDRTGMTVSIDATSLFTSEGLTTKRRTSTQRERVQLVYARRLWMQGLFGRETVRYASADVTLNRGEGAVRQELALNVPDDTWGTMAATIAHRQVIGPAWLRPKPRAAATATTVRWAVAGLVAGLVGVAAVAVVAALPDVDPLPGRPLTWTVGCLLIGVGSGLAFGLVRGRKRLAVEGWAVTADDLLVRRGLLRRTTLLLFAHKAQAVDVVSGPLQRRLGLATVLVDVAPPGHEHRVVIHDVSTADATALLTSLVASGSVPLPNGV